MFFKINKRKPDFVFFCLGKQPAQKNVATEKELDEFLVDLVKKHGLKTVKQTLKSKK